MKYQNFNIVNCDTDSVMVNKKDHSAFSINERETLLQELNSLYPEIIKFEDDGYFNCVVVLKAKNYILYDGKKITKKGSSLKSSKTEIGLKSFMSEIIDCLVFEKQSEIINVYHKYIKEVFNVQDISRWVSKKTITEAVLNPERTTEQKILNAVNGRHVSMGDKIYVYFAKDESLKMQMDWLPDNPDHDAFVLLKKLYKTLEIFENVININDYPKYHLKNKLIRQSLIDIIGFTPLE